MKVESKSRRLATWAAVSVLSLSVILLGCPAQSTLAALVSTLGNSASSIAALEGNSSLATKIQTDTQAASTAVLNWKSGTPATEAIEAINLVEDDLSLFPITGQYAPLIDLALGTAESIIEILNPTGATTPATTAHAAHRTVTLPFAAPKTSSAYKKQWNAIVAQNPSLKSAKL